MTQQHRAPAQPDAPETMSGGIALGTTVLTLEGELPVEYLAPGDRIVTRTGVRVLRDVVARRIETGLYRIAQDVLGADRPASELHVAAGTLLAIRDWRAAALYGAKTAIVPVERLSDGSYIAPIAGATTVFTLGFDDTEVVYAEGIEVACAPLRVTA
ncbi:Hint domain-containing protein [Frigidibacter sp. MR17.24]|uniref:Hint domain-containing protein n=1 Tax=Frigidibacter sp. MR17.24 TaxID=3127345 RepID=UPI003012F652